MTVAGLLTPGSLLRAAEPSASKLSVHLIAQYTTGARQIVNAHPRVLKILDTHGSMLTAAREFKTGTPNGKVVLRIYTTRGYSRQDDPAASAADFWNVVLAPRINALSPADRALIDYLEGPNEGDSTPTWGSLQDAQWFGDFWVALAPLIGNAGFKPCAFSIAVGNPPGDSNYVRQVLDRLAPALRQCQQYGGGWSYHAYTPQYNKDTNYQIWYALRYRQYYSYFATRYPDLVNLPLVLTEGGYDTGGSPTGSGWQAHVTAAQYQDWLSWFDQRLRENPYVVGCTLFQLGDVHGWPSFDCEPIAGWLAGHLAASVPSFIDRSPDTLSSFVIKGSNAAAQTLTIRNGGGGTMSYTVSDDAAWLSVDPAGGTSTGETDTLTVNYTTAPLNPGKHTATITVTAVSASNSPQTIAITLEVINPSPPGDFDGDRDVDAQDFATFQGCMTGPNAGPYSPGCEDADLDRDGDVDQADFGVFQRCFSGIGVPADMTCAD